MGLWRRWCRDQVVVVSGRMFSGLYPGSGGRGRGRGGGSGDAMPTVVAAAPRRTRSRPGAVATRRIANIGHAADVVDTVDITGVTDTVAITGVVATTAATTALPLGTAAAAAASETPLAGPTSRPYFVAWNGDRAGTRDRTSRVPARTRPAHVGSGRNPPRAQW